MPPTNIPTENPSPFLDGAKRTLTNNEYSIFERAWKGLNFSKEDLSQDTQSRLAKLAQEMGEGGKEIIKKLTPTMPEWMKKTNETVVDAVKHPGAVMGVASDAAQGIARDHIPGYKQAQDAMGMIDKVKAVLANPKDFFGGIFQALKDFFGGNKSSLKDFFANFFGSFGVLEGGKKKLFELLKGNVIIEKVWSKVLENKDLLQINIKVLRETWEKYQKNNTLNLPRELGIKIEQTELVTFLEKFFHTEAYANITNQVRSKNPNYDESNITLGSFIQTLGA